MAQSHRGPYAGPEAAGCRLVVGPEWMKETQVIERILFVCLGNICRSPGAEAVTRARAEAAGLALTLDSAGTSGWHIGDPPYKPMMRAARARGYDMSGLRARTFEARDFVRFDLILGMDARNVRDIETLRPEGNGTPCRLLTCYAPASGVEEVPDPYYTRDFDGAMDLIEECVDGLIAALSKAR